MKDRRSSRCSPHRARYPRRASLHASALVAIAIAGALLAPRTDAGAQPARRAATPAAAAATPAPTPATAGSAWDRRARERATESIRLANDPAGLVPLLDLFGMQTRVDPTVMRAEFERILAGRLPEDRRAIARWMRALVIAHTGDRVAATREIDALGFVRDLIVVGPFDNDGKSGFEQELPPESIGTGTFPIDVHYDGKDHEVSFREYPRDAAWDGFVSLRSVVRPARNVCAFAATTITLPRAQNVALLAGAAGAIRIFWNGTAVLSDAAIRGDYPDRSRAIVAGRSGANRVLVKVCNGDGGLGFYLRALNENGTALRGARVDASTMPAPAAAARAGRAPTAQPTAFERMRTEAEAEDATAAELEAYAHFLILSGSDDRDERKARQHAARAVDLEPTLDRIELAYQLADERGERMRFVAVAATRFPDDPRTRILRARSAIGGPRPADAMPLLAAFDPPGVEGLVARRLRASLYAELGLERAALAEVHAVADAAPRAHEVVLELAQREDAAGHRDEAMALRGRALALRYDDIGSRSAILGDLAARRDIAGMATPLTELHALVRYDDAGLAGLAATYDAIDDLASAERLLGEAIELAPEEPARRVALGRLLLRTDRSAEAIASLHRGLELRPQDTDTRTLLEQLESTARDDEAAATPIDAILGRRRDDVGYPLSFLHDLTVNTVYANGLSSSFRQVAIQVHDEEGARSLRGYPIPYEPSIASVDVRSARVYRRNGDVLEATEQFEQPMADPAYRMYYDSVNLVVVLPTLEPGDVVEIRYRVDDTAAENRMADYYGDLRVLQGSLPTARFEYVLRTPTSRAIFANAPALAGLSHERTEAEGRTTDRYVATNVPALRGEERMPGPTEIAPYLHVSTYSNWRDVGRWYWGLVHDQLIPDDELKRTVRELVAGAPDEATKVRRIHDWVVDHTRYVALEFGIHGYKPYRVTQVVRRGFGDCKDKASLLFAMFREAGIDAHIVLVRTRRNGNIADAPASLAIFDHAIAYVPSMDLYIDGTAEHSGMRELPEMDQGVTVLHVWADGSELRRTPVLPADRSRRERTYEFRLARDGSADVHATETVVGSEAAYVRANFEAEGTREERLRTQLRGAFPGIELTSQTMTNLGDREAMPSIEWNGHVPRLAQADGEGLRVAPSAITDLVRMLAPTPTRTFALELGGLTTYVEHRTFVVPAGLRIGTLPEGGEAASPFGRVSIRFESSGDRVTSHVELVLSTDRVAAGDFAAYRAWVDAADRLFRKRIALEVSP